MPEQRLIEIYRIITARKMDIPPDDVDMSIIFKCVKRSIEEKVDKNLNEAELFLTTDREAKAVVGEIGETVIPLMFNCEYPFGDFVNDYELYYKSKVKN